MGKHIVVLNSIKAAMTMLDKKGSKYSDRPIFPMGGELVGSQCTFGGMYGHFLLLIWTEITLGWWAP